jgi:hypothetical protein
MNPADIAASPESDTISIKSGAISPTFVSFLISDPEVLIALSEFPEGAARTNFLMTALKVGVLSLKAARGSLDSDTLRREGDRLMEELGSRLNTWRSKFEERVTGSLAHYFDPQQGTFMERVHRLTKADGDLASVVKQQVQEAGSNLSKVFEQFIGENSRLFRMLDPTGDNQLVATLQRTLDGVVHTQNQVILGQFSLDNKDGALVRFLNELAVKYGDLNKALSRDMQGIVAEFSLDNEESALSRLVSRVEAAQGSITAELSLDNEDSALQRLHKMLRENHQALLKQQLDLASRLDTAIESMKARRTESAKSTRHGVEFESTLGTYLREVVQAAGDILEDTGSTTGLKPNCKIGDYVMIIGHEKVAAGARIVVEAKESSSYDLTKTLEEADTARINRRADVCVFVHSVKTAPASIPVFQRFGRDIVVKWDPDDDALDVWLQAALMVATALSVKAASHDKKDAASFEKIDKAIERIRKHLEGFEEINTSANTAKNAAEKILNRAAKMQEGLSTYVQSIIDEVTKMKEDSVKG